jgi:sugar/nucleoside kinase (ribokinase family)
MSFDPLATQRGPDGPGVDLLLQGTVFLDIILTGLPTQPKPGTEVWAEGMGSCPGGAANLAVAASRLGLRTSLAAAFGDDDYGDFCWRTLEQQEGVDLSCSRRYAGWHSPVTVSFAVDRDRSMVTHEHDPPECATTMMGTPPRSRVAHVDLAPGHPIGTPDGHSWVDRALADGALIFADVGWDPTGEWSPGVLDELESCHCFIPNAAEAMAYTRTDSVVDALYDLADRVPIAVVTNGEAGAYAIDSVTGEEAHVPALRVSAIDPTGAGDVFDAAVILGTLAEWPLTDRLAFATLCAALAVQQVGGSLAAPGWGDIADWWHRVRDDPSDRAALTVARRRYTFLDEIVPDLPPGAMHRAAATIARLSDA